MLKEKGVNTVVASEFGLGALAMLEKQKFGVSVVKAGTGVSDVIRDKLYRRRKTLALLASFLPL
ncbi:MAG: hypothetical protein ACUVQM_06900 [Candidatus Hadarchaeaceae archaeon]